MTAAAHPTGSFLEHKLTWCTQWVKWPVFHRITLLQKSRYHVRHVQINWIYCRLMQVHADYKQSSIKSICLIARPFRQCTCLSSAITHIFNHVHHSLQSFQGSLSKWRVCTRSSHNLFICLEQLWTLESCRASQNEELLKSAYCCYKFHLKNRRFLQGLTDHMCMQQELLLQPNAQVLHHSAGQIILHGKAATAHCRTIITATRLQGTFVDQALQVSQVNAGCICLPKCRFDACAACLSLEKKVHNRNYTFHRGL